MSSAALGQQDDAYQRIRAKYLLNQSMEDLKKVPSPKRFVEETRPAANHMDISFDPNESQEPLRLHKRKLSDDDNRSRKSHKRGAGSPNRSRDELAQSLPPLNASLDLSQGKGILNFSNRKKSTGGSSNKSAEKLPKASQNMTYTMEKFVSSRELAIFDVLAS